MSQAAAKRMARDRYPGKIVFVSSLLGYMSMIGYASYSPAKHALRGVVYLTFPVTGSLNRWLAGLAETLRSELLLYSVGVHIFFPGTIYSPGYIEENKTKPKVTLKIEETDDGVSPEQAAEGLLKGMSSSILYHKNHLPTRARRRSEWTVPHNCGSDRQHLPFLDKGSFTPQ